MVGEFVHYALLEEVFEELVWTFEVPVCVDSNYHHHKRHSYRNKFVGNTYLISNHHDCYTHY
jgi:hypothetical protein